MGIAYRLMFLFTLLFFFVAVTRLWDAAATASVTEGYNAAVSSVIPSVDAFVTVTFLGFLTYGIRLARDTIRATGVLVEELGGLV